MSKEQLRKLTGLLSFVNRLIPKSRKKIVFYSNMGFRDNVKAVYDYLITCPGSHYKIICAVNDWQEFAAKPHPKGVRFVSPLRGVWHFFTSRYFFYSFGKYPVKPAPNQMVVNLWHGSPLKKIGNYLDDQDQNFFTILLAASDFFVPIMQKAFNCRPEQVVVCGHPRNDALFQPGDPLSQLGLAGSWKRLILWLPTFRQSAFLGNQDASVSGTGLPILQSREEMERINEVLAASDTLLIAKIHPAQDLEQIDTRGFSHIRILTNDQMQKAECNLYQLLASADGLITDYSSVYFDYLLLNRPIGFTVDDIEEYTQNRGFVVDDPRPLMPGRFIHTPEEFSLFVGDVIAGSDSYEAQRKKVGELANRYHDGMDCKRVLELAGIL